MNLQELAKLAGRRAHLAIFTEPYLSLLLANQKTVESRWSEHRIAPFRRVEEGDLVYVKKSGGPVVARFFAGRVNDVQNPRLQWDWVLTHKEALCVDNAFLESVKHKDYLTLIHVEYLEKIDPFSLEKTGRAGWVVLPYEAAEGRLL